MTNNFPGLKNKTETETFNFGLMEPRPRPRLSFWVSWNRDRDRDFNMKSRETETFTRPDILSLGGTETGTETTKVSVPRVSAPRPPISGEYPLWSGRQAEQSWNMDHLLEPCDRYTTLHYTTLHTGEMPPVYEGATLKCNFWLVLAL